MTNPPYKLKTPCRVFTRRDYGIYKQPMHYTVAEALKNCARHKREAEKMAKGMRK